jgi:putative transposase
MARPKQERPPPPPVWRVPDELWALVAPILAAYDPPAATGRKRIDQREALNAIIFRLRTGVQWNHLPAALPDDSSVHRTFQRWLQRGVLDRVWAVVQEACEDLDGVDWEWQAADTATSKARKGGAAWARTRPIVPSPA